MVQAPLHLCHKRFQSFHTCLDKAIKPPCLTSLCWCLCWCLTSSLFSSPAVDDVLVKPGPLKDHTLITHVSKLPDRQHDGGSPEQKTMQGIPCVRAERVSAMGLKVGSQGIPYRGSPAQRTMQGIPCIRAGRVSDMGVKGWLTGDPLTQSLLRGSPVSGQEESWLWGSRLAHLWNKPHDVEEAQEHKPVSVVQGKLEEHTLHGVILVAKCSPNLAASLLHISTDGYVMVMHDAVLRAWHHTHCWSSTHWLSRRELWSSCPEVIQQRIPSGTGLAAGSARHRFPSV